MNSKDSRIDLPICINDEDLIITEELQNYISLGKEWLHYRHEFYGEGLDKYGSKINRYYNHFSVTKYTTINSVQINYSYLDNTEEGVYLLSINSLGDELNIPIGEDETFATDLGRRIMEAMNVFK